MNEPWVVTYRIDYCETTMVVEFYRGSFEDCIRIFERSASGEDDQRKTKSWQAVAGPARLWDKFIEGM